MRESRGVLSCLSVFCLSALRKPASNTDRVFSGQFLKKKRGAVGDAVTDRREGTVSGKQIPS